MVYYTAINKIRKSLWVSLGSIRAQMYLVLLAAKSWLSIVST